MSLRGIIAGALGGVGSAVTKIGAEEMAQQNRMAVYDKQAELEERKLRLADELSRSRAEWEVSTDGLGGKRIEFETQRTKKVGAAQTGVELEREQTLAPERRKSAVDQAVAVKTAEGNLEREQTIARGTDQQYLASKRALKRAEESSASLAQAGLAQIQLADAQLAQRLRKELSDARAKGDEEGVSRAQQKITDNAFTGKDTSKAYSAYVAASTKLIDLESKLEDQSRMLGDAEKASLKRQVAETQAVLSAAMKDLGVKMPDKPDAQAQAHADAKAAVATGRISLEEANKRLLSANFKPIEGPPPGAKAPGPAVPAAAGRAPEGSRPISQPEPPDSPSAQWKARQAKLKADKEAWETSQSESAQKLFEQTNLKDVWSAQALQESPLFSYLTPQQKAQVQNAVLGRTR